MQRNLQRCPCYIDGSNSSPMSTSHVLLMTDLVDSTQLSERLGDDVATLLWEAHDRIARDLLRLWRGQEIDKSDGFLLLFEQIEDAVGCAQALHQALAKLEPPLSARAGIHIGTLRLRANRDDDIRQGAKPVEVDGIAKPLAARIMGLARGGQTLLSTTAGAALVASRWQLVSHGFWRLKGLPEPIELFEIDEPGAPAQPPADSIKGYRVIAADGGWKPLRETQHSLPFERDGFVGRAEPLAALARRFHDGGRLVTVLGIGGIGKTRLALRFARDWLGDYPGGAWFCDLSTARDLDGLLQATAHGLGVPLGKVDPVLGIGEAVAARGHCLLVLDNFEQVARHSEATVGCWLAAAPEAQVLVTSREVLGIGGEQVLALPSLPADEAVQLFRQRALAADSGWQPKPVDAEAITSLVDLLDRLPLAIELAASRVRVLAPRTMLARMDQRFRLLGPSNGRRDRQATLRATLDWSWELLAPSEQSALAQLAVFSGSFRLDDAEVVIDLSTVDDAPWAVDVLQHLVEKSLLRRLPGGRFDLLRTVQDYASEHLAASDRDGQTARRHWQRYAGFDDERATADVCADLDNLVVACRRATIVEPTKAVDALVATWSALRLTGPFRALLELAAPLLSQTSMQARECMRLHGVVSSALRHLGDMARAEQHLAIGLRAAAASSDDALEDHAQLLVWLTELELQRGHLGEASAALQRASALAERCDSQALRLRILNASGSLCRVQGQQEAAIRDYTEALGIARALGNVRWEGGCEGNLGVVRHAQGRLAEAAAHYRRAVALATQVGDRAFEGNSRCNLGLLLHEQGDDAAADAALSAAATLARQIGHQRLECTARCNLGIVHESLGSTEMAIQDYALAISQARKLGDSASEGQFRGYLALLQARLGRAADALPEFDRAAELIGTSADPELHVLLAAQRALACGLLGDAANASHWVGRATALAAPLDLGPESEVHRLLAQARQATPPAVIAPIPD